MDQKVLHVLKSTWVDELLRSWVYKIMRKHPRQGFEMENHSKPTNIDCPKTFLTSVRAHLNRQVTQMMKNETSIFINMLDIFASYFTPHGSSRLSPARLPVYYRNEFSTLYLWMYCLIFSNNNSSYIFFTQIETGSLLSLQFWDPLKFSYSVARLLHFYLEKM